MFCIGYKLVNDKTLTWTRPSHVTDMTRNLNIYEFAA